MGLADFNTSAGCQTALGIETGKLRLSLDCTPVPRLFYACGPSFGGIEIPTLGNPLDPLQTAIDSIRGLMAALPPLKINLDIIQVIIDMFQCLIDIPMSILTLDPTKAIDCLRGLAIKIAQLAMNQPPFSLIKLIAGFLCLIIFLIDVFLLVFEYIKKAVLELLCGFQFNLTLLDPELTAIISCGDRHIKASYGILDPILNVINKILGVYNIFAQIAQLDEITFTIPTLEFGAGVDVNPEGVEAHFLTVMEPMEKIRDTLQAALNLIPGGLAQLQG